MIRSIAIGLIGALVAYGLAAFIAADLDITSWPPFGRAGAAVAMLWFGVVAFAISEASE